MPPYRVVAGKKQAILVVEDEPSIASFVGMYLKRAGFIVRVAGTGGDALEKASADPPALIILDLMLPDLDGIDVCRRVRQRSDVDPDAECATRTSTRSSGSRSAPTTT